MQQLQQQVDTIETNLQQLPTRLQQAQAAWQQSYQQLSQLTEQFQTWLPLIDEKLADVLSGVDELIPLFKGIDNKLDEIIDKMAQIGLSPQIDVHHEFVYYDSNHLLQIQHDIAAIKQQLATNSQYRSQLALIEGSICSSQGDLNAAKQQFIQARDQAPNDDKRALACFNRFQVYLRDHS